MTQLPPQTLGIDIGGLRIKYVRMSGQDKVYFDIIELEPSDRSTEGMLSVLKKIVDHAGPDHRVGIGVPGIVRLGDGVVVQSPNFPTWENFNLAGQLSEIIQRPVVIDNDANAFLRAECRLGAAAGRQDVLGLTLGTGLGGGFWAKGRIYRGARGMAGELGHVCFQPNGVLCGCGNYGCIEQYASTQFLARRARELGVESVQGVPLVRVGRILADEARAGDAKALQVYREMGANLGISVAGMVNLTDVEMIVTGGGISGAYDLFGGAFEETVRDRVYRAIAEDLEFEVATLGREAGAVGAALLALGDYDNFSA